MDHKTAKAIERLVTQRARGTGDWSESQIAVLKYLVETGRHERRWAVYSLAILPWDDTDGRDALRLLIRDCRVSEITQPQVAMDVDHRMFIIAIPQDSAVDGLMCELHQPYWFQENEYIAYAMSVKRGIIDDDVYPDEIIDYNEMGIPVADIN